MRSYTHICFLLLVFIALSCGEQEQNVVAWINNEAITKAELKHWMLLEKANVYNYFYRKYGVNDNNKFWTQKQGNEIPIDKLKKTALEKAKRCKIQQIIALNKGLIETTNFDNIIGELETVNAERERKVENGEPVYGPVQFTSRTYFSHVFDKMKIELKTELAKDELKPDKKDLLGMQKDLTQSLEDISGFLTMQYVDLNYESYIDKQMIGLQINLNEAVYKKISID